MFVSRQSTTLVEFRHFATAKMVIGEMNTNTCASRLTITKDSA